MSVRLLVSFSIAVCFVFHAERPRAQQQPPPSPSPQQQQKPDPAASPGEKKPAPSKIANPYASTYQPLPSQTTVIRNATILTAAGPVIERGSVLLQNGKVAAVGQNVNAPADAVVIDASGKWVTPGVIDTHSHLGVYSAPGIESLQDGNEMTNPVTAEVWADHSIWPQDPQFELALAGGVTAMQILPGSGNLFGGRGVTVKNVPSRTAEGMKFPGAPAGLEDGVRRESAARLRPAQPDAGDADGQHRGVPPDVAGGGRLSRQVEEVARRRIRSGQASRSQPADGDAGRRARRRDPRPQPLLSRRRDGDDDPARRRSSASRSRSFHHAVEAYKVRDLLAAEQHLREHVGRLVGIQARGVRRHHARTSRSSTRRRGARSSIRTMPTGSSG